MKTETEPPSWMKRIKKLFHLDPQTLEQLIAVLRKAQQSAIISPETLNMMEGVMLLSQMQVRDIMLPKNQMTCIDHETPLPEVFNIITQSGHSRFPVIDDNQEVIGILHAKDLLRLKQEDTDDNFLTDLIRQATFVPESRRLDLLLSDFRANRNHLAIVVDEYGAIAGFITLEDIVEQIIGDIEDEFDIDEETYIKMHDDAHYIIKAHTPIDEFNEQLNTHFSDDSYDTIGGIVMSHFGYLPKRGEIITIDGFEFKVIHADARRIKLLACFDKRTRDSHGPSPIDH